MFILHAFTDVSQRAVVDSWRSNEEGRELINQTFPVGVDQLFNMLYTNSKFFQDFHLSRKTFGKSLETDLIALSLIEHGRVSAPNTETIYQGYEVVFSRGS